MDGRYVTIETSQTISGNKTITGVFTSSKSPFVRRMLVDTSNYETGLRWESVVSKATLATISYHNTARRLFLHPLAVDNGYDDKVGNYALKIGVNELTYNMGHIWYSGNSNKNNVNWVCRNSYVERGVIARSMRFNNFLAYYDSNTAQATGTICITLPNAWTNSMNIYEIVLYEYNDLNCSTINIGAYNFAGGSNEWYNYKYNTKGNYNKGVRLAYNGSKCVILLGNTTTTWTYLKVFLRTVYVGHSNTNIWDDGYTITIITNESGYTSVVSPNRSSEYFGNTSVSGLTVNGSSTFHGHLLPGTNAAFNIGSETQKWATVYTNGGLQVQKSSYGPGLIELYFTTPFIDFHFNNSTSDYTSRIIEEASGRLAFTGQTKHNGHAYFGGLTWYFANDGRVFAKSLASASNPNFTSETFNTRLNDEYMQYRMLGANGSYTYEVILLLPVPTTNTTSGTNKINGRFRFYTLGANQAGYIDIFMQPIYGRLRWQMRQAGQRTGWASLKTCTYGGVKYYCIDIPYVANRWDYTYFEGICSSQLTGGDGTIILPQLLRYKTAANGGNAEVVNIPEINNSLSSTILTGGIGAEDYLHEIINFNIYPFTTNAHSLGTGTNRWRYLYATNIDLTGSVAAPGGFYGSLMNTNPQLAASYETNEIVVANNSGVSSLNHAIKFRWYANYYQIGIVRGGSTDALGFSICNNTTEIARFNHSAINTFTRIYVNNPTEATVNGGSIATSGGIYASKSIYAGGAITAMQTSDYALKHNFDGTIDYRQKLLLLGRVYDYNYNDKALRLYEGTLDRKRHTGLIYQNARLAGITGFCHDLDKNGYGGLNYLSPDLMATVIGAVQANILSIRMVESEQERIRKELAKAKAEIAELKRELARRGS